MIAYLAFLLLVLSCWHTTAFLLENETDCPTEALVDLTEDFDWNGDSLIRNEPRFIDGVLYPPDTIKQQGDRFFGCPCRTTGCLPLCCDNTNCLKKVDLLTDFEKFMPIFDPENFVVDKNGTSLNRMPQFAWNPCHGNDGYELDKDEYRLLTNGSLYLTDLKYAKNYTDFCIRYLNSSYTIMLCFDEDTFYDVKNPIIFVTMLISVPFLIATFAVYMLIFELRNLHGQTLCAYIFSLIIAYTSLSILKIVQKDIISNLMCCCFAYIVYFSFLASFFWLNVICFDIWWTFGVFRSLHENVKQRERKKFIMYSLYAWGCASILTMICMIIDMVPGIPAYIIRPKFGNGRCWFGSYAARAIYFYGPMGVTVLCNICLFILTAFKIMRHKKNTARQLKGNDSRRHDDNKQWFNLYLKLFIVMGIIWSMEIISWLFENTLPSYVWYITDLANTLHGVIIFVIFVCKNKVKRLLIKRFSFQGSKLLFCNSTTRSGCTINSSTSRMTCVSPVPLQEKINLYTETEHSKPIVIKECL